MKCNLCKFGYLGTCSQILSLYGLLKEVVNEELFAAKHGAVTAPWVTVASNLNNIWDLDEASGVTGPMCQKRFKALMDVFCKEELDALRASGTGKEYGVTAAIAPAASDTELKKQKLELEESKLAFERKKFIPKLEDDRKDKLFEQEERRTEKEDHNAHNKQMMEMFQLLAKHI
ncbi:hypothetical protein HDU77_001662 [Chytriomyces hyalinus]|nr:hypothetical protein HDU77_001662 [Chytriomyces hyalinus]